MTPSLPASAIRPATDTQPTQAPAAGAQEAAATARRVLAMQAQVLSHRGHAQAATAFCTELAAQFGCSRVLLGVWHDGGVDLAAVSNGAPDLFAGETFAAPGAAMEESAQQGCAIHFPAAADAPLHIRVAHQRWQQRVGGAVLSLPMVHGGTIVGAVACEWTTGRDDLARLASQIEDIVAFSGPVLHLLQGLDQPWHRRARLAAAGAWERLFHAGDRRLQVALATAVAGTVGLALVPVDHEVAGRARIEGEQQRVMVAPADGFLQAAHARPGDRVRRGQVLVEMADQDLLLEQRRWASELAQQESAYAVALSRAERGQMVIAMARVEQARAQLARAEAQIQRARVVAPFDGVVIQGDLAPTVGAPLTRGAPLLTMAPDERYRLVVEVDERDIAAVVAGQTGALSLASQPWQRLPLSVTRVTPVARAAEGRNVFEVDAKVEPGTVPVRPGLEGVARITVGQRSTAWIWTHRLVDWLRLQAWAWWG